MHLGIVYLEKRPMPAFDGLVGMDMRKVLDELGSLFGEVLDEL